VEVNGTKEHRNGSTSPTRTFGGNGLRVPRILNIPADVKDILADIRATVLKGCVLTFTGVIPLGTRPEDSAVWQLAVRHGAECTRDFVLGWTTHVVVASSRGIITEKSRQALETGASFCVHARWLEDCTMHFEVRPELFYSVAPPEGDQAWVEYRESVYATYRKMRGTADSETLDVLDSYSKKKPLHSETNVNGLKRPRAASPKENAAVARAKLSHPSNDVASAAPASRERVLGDDELDDALDAALDYASDT
jgi:hypothetical protein